MYMRTTERPVICCFPIITLTKKLKTNNQNNFKGELLNYKTQRIEPKSNIIHQTN
jgi:hypothetical protein